LQTFDANGLRCPFKIPSCSPSTSQEPSITSKSPLPPLEVSESQSDSPITPQVNQFEDTDSNISETFPMASSPIAKKTLPFQTPELRRSPRKHKRCSSLLDNISPKRQESEVNMNKNLYNILCASNLFAIYNFSAYHDIVVTSAKRNFHPCICLCLFVCLSA
jgi:hypothetical protein